MPYPTKTGHNNRATCDHQLHANPGSPTMPRTRSTLADSLRSLAESSSLHVGPYLHRHLSAFAGALLRICTT